MNERTLEDKKKLHHKLLGEMGRALCDFKMLAPNDRVLVAVSGGKDSLSLLKLLSERRRMTPFPFELIALHVQVVSRQGSLELRRTVEGLFQKWEVPYEIAEIDFSMTGEDGEPSKDCFWCSWNRRKTLFEAARRLRCTKLALGHHRDDLIETALLNLFHQGKFATMLPEQAYFKGEFHMIRPFCYAEEEDIRQFADDSAFPRETCRCLIGDQGRRAETERLLNTFTGDPKALRSNIFRAILRTLQSPGGTEET